jgi:hypothetical protein
MVLDDRAHRGASEAPPPTFVFSWKRPNAGLSMPARWMTWRTCTRPRRVQRCRRCGASEGSSASTCMGTTLWNTVVNHGLEVIRAVSAESRGGIGVLRSSRGAGQPQS